MNKLLIRCPMRLPDHLVLNGLYREMAKHYDEVVVPVMAHNWFSVQFMLRDMKNVEVVRIESGMDMNRLNSRMDTYKSVNLARSDRGNWDRSYYDQMNLKHALRWENWHVDRDERSEISISGDTPFAVLHDDPYEENDIDPAMGPAPEMVCINIRRGHPIWDFYGLLSNAEEIHVIPGAYLILADMIPTKAKQLVVHQYCKNVPLPVLNKDWEIINQ